MCAGERQRKRHPHTLDTRQTHLEAGLLDERGLVAHLAHDCLHGIVCVDIYMCVCVCMLM